jgi:hypothetical protein
MIAAEELETSSKAKIFGITERVVDLNGTHVRRTQHQGRLTYAEAVKHVAAMQADPKHEASGFNEEFAYWWARVPAGQGHGDGHVRRWSIELRY